MNKYFICIIDRYVLNKIQNNEIWGVKKSNINALKKSKKGDKLIFYVKAGRLNDKSYAPSIFGIYEINSDIYYDSSDIFKFGTEVFPNRVKIKQIFKMKESKSFKPLITKLNFGIISKYIKK
jgi:predicted RNA-binding protein